MNRILKLMMAVMVTGLMMAGGLSAQEEMSAQEEGGASVSVGVDVASAYVFRGATFNDGLVVQPGVEVEGLPITFGVWGNLDIGDYDGALAEGEFSEIDLYGSYALPIELLDVSVGYTEYVYPGAASEADREVGASFGIEKFVSLGLDLFYGVDGGIDGAFYAEASVGYEYEVVKDAKLGAGASLAYAAPDEGESGLSHYTVTGSASYRFLSASVTYIGQIDDEVLTDEAYDVEVIGTVGASMSF